MSGDTNRMVNITLPPDVLKSLLKTDDPSTPATLSLNDATDHGELMELLLMQCDVIDSLQSILPTTQSKTNPPTACLVTSLSNHKTTKMTYPFMSRDRVSLLVRC